MSIRVSARSRLISLSLLRKKVIGDEEFPVFGGDVCLFRLLRWSGESMIVTVKCRGMEPRRGISSTVDSGDDRHE